MERLFLIRLSVTAEVASQATLPRGADLQQEIGEEHILRERVGRVLGTPVHEPVLHLREVRAALLESHL
jgi:hypothetical protein